MVSAQNEKILRILDLVCQQQAYGLQRLFASINVISVDVNGSADYVDDHIYGEEDMTKK